MHRQSEQQAIQSVSMEPILEQLEKAGLSMTDKEAKQLGVDGVMKRIQQAYKATR